MNTESGLNYNISLIWIKATDLPFGRPPPASKIKSIWGWSPYKNHYSRFPSNRARSKTHSTSAWSASANGLRPVIDDGHDWHGGQPHDVFMKNNSSLLAMMLHVFNAFATVLMLVKAFYTSIQREWAWQLQFIISRYSWNASVQTSKPSSSLWIVILT